ncbi:BCAM protein, partial [Polypterus senegalus]
MVDTSDSDQYSCIFVTYPTGSFHGIIRLTVVGYLVTSTYDKGLHQLKSQLFLNINDSLNHHSLKCEGLYTEPSNETVRIGSDTVNVSAHPAHNISINIMQEKQFIAEGDDVIILCMSSVPADKYMFLAGKQKTAIHNGTSNEVILQKIRRSQSGVYSCSPQWSDFDSFKEENIEIFVNYLDDIECSHSHLIKVEEFHDLNISCLSNASKSPVYTWIKGASIISNSSSLILTNITKLRVGRYTVIAEIPGSRLKRQKQIMVLLDEGNIMPLTNIPDTAGTTLNGYNSSQVASTSYIQKTEDASGITTSPSNILTRYTTADPEGKTAATGTSSWFTLTNVTLLKENPNSSALLSTRDKANLIVSVNAVSIYKNETTDPVNVPNHQHDPTQPPGNNNPTTVMIHRNWDIQELKDVVSELPDPKAVGGLKFVQQLQQLDDMYKPNVAEWTQVLRRKLGTTWATVNHDDLSGAPLALE